MDIKDCNIVKELNREIGPAFMTFSLPCDEETAILQFESRYGFKPETVMPVPNNLMLGPAPEIELCQGEVE